VSLWGVHSGVAVIFTTLLIGYFRLSRHRGWTLVGINGVWATVPDWWWLFTERFVSRLQSPWFARTYRELFHDSLVANLFWFHGVIDTVGSDAEGLSILVGTSSLAVFLLMEYYLAREVTRGDRKRNRIQRESQ
jgi:hypothetical protein